jgi:hypothetical protein
MLGRENVAGPTLSSLAQNFGLAPLIGKPLAIISDARLGGRTDAQVIVERLLAITGEDWLSIDRKFLPAWNGQLPTRFVVLTNELPKLGDASGAIASRFIVLRLVHSFYGQEDLSLTKRLIEEAPGILLWAIEGLQRLTERGYFVQPASARQAAEELSDLASPVGAFVRERCIVAQSLSGLWITGLRHLEVGHDSAEIPTKGLDRTFVIATLLLAPARPSSITGRSVFAFVSRATWFVPDPAPIRQRYAPWHVNCPIL